MLSSQLEKLFNSTQTHINTYGLECYDGILQNTSTLIDTIDYLRNSDEYTQIAIELLNGVQAAIIEVIGCLSLGLVRPALFSMRAQIDMLLAWLYFKDHPIEWKNAQETSSGFKMKSEVLKYLQKYYSEFDTRMRILERNTNRRTSDPYKLLSAHIHSQNNYLTPKVGELEKIVSSIDMCRDCIYVQREVSEYLCDIVICCFGSKWASLPDSLVSSVRSRLSPKLQKQIFE